MGSATSKEEFAVLARRSGVPLTDAEVEILLEGYVLIEQLRADLDRPADAAVEPALVFAPRHAQWRR